MGRMTHYTGDYYHVFDYGAFGNGITDDTAGLQACIYSANGAVVFIPPGIFPISNTLIVPAGTSIVGCGSAVSMILNNKANTGFAMKVVGEGNNDFMLGGVVRALNIHANALGNGGLLLEDTFTHVVEEVKVQCAQLGDYGIALRHNVKGSSYNTVRDCFVYGAQMAAFDNDGKYPVPQGWANRNNFVESWAYVSEIGFDVKNCSTATLRVATEGCGVGVALNNSERNRVELYSEADGVPIDEGSGTGNQVNTVSM